MKFCVCGGGSLAHAVAAVLGTSSDNHVSVLTRYPLLWSDKITLKYEKSEIEGNIDLISASAGEVIPEADIILILVPHAFREEVLKSIAPFVKPMSWVGSFPGFAGFSWMARFYLGQSVKIFGLQRVPFVCKKETYGRSVVVTGIRPRNYIASVPSVLVNEITHILRKATNLYIVPMSNYLNVCFSRSNSVFHPARIYALCKDYQGGQNAIFTEPLKFYADWNDASSDVFFALDREMIKASQNIPLDLRWAQPLLQHYEIAFEKDLSLKIGSLKSLEDRPFPLRTVEGGFIPDIESYYFKEDIVYGLSTLKAIYQLLNMQTPVTDQILRWGQELLGCELIMENGELTDHFECKPWPQRFGIKTLEDLISFCNYGTLPS